MYTIQTEIFTQPSALMQTQALFQEKRDQIYEFITKPYQNIIFIGCGSGFMLSEGAAAMFSMYTDKKAVAISGGEIILSPDKYCKLIANSLVIIASRSGETSEVLFALEKMRELTTFKTMGIIANTDCSLKPYLDFTLEIPWAFDHSICQTRTISNIYYSLSMLLAIYLKNKQLETSFQMFFGNQLEFLEEHKKKCQEIAQREWNNVTVLGDGEISGIASEGSLAFTEICILPGEYFNILDYRHGPIVLADEKKLFLVLVNPNENNYQKQMIKDIKNRGSYVITLGHQTSDYWESDYHVSLSAIENSITWGIPFINICQMLAFYKALVNDHNPDIPGGLNPYISLK